MWLLGFTFPQLSGAPLTPLNSVPLHPLFGRLIPGGLFALSPSTRSSQLAAAGNFRVVICQVLRLAFIKPLYAFKQLTFAYKQHSLVFFSC